MCHNNFYKDFIEINSTMIHNSCISHSSGFLEEYWPLVAILVSKNYGIICQHEHSLQKQISFTYFPEY